MSIRNSQSKLNFRKFQYPNQNNENKSTHVKHVYQRSNALYLGKVNCSCLASYTCHATCKNKGQNKL